VHSNINLDSCCRCIFFYFLFIILYLFIFGRVPSVKVKRQELKCKLGAKTLEARIKGVYDLLVKKEDQARYCGRGKGTSGRVPVPREIFEAMCGKPFDFVLFSFPFLFFPFSCSSLILSSHMLLAGFFNDKAKMDVTKTIVECINQKGSDARSFIKRKALTTSKESSGGIPTSADPVTSATAGSSTPS
jgi:hypothetical protein